MNQQRDPIERTLELLVFGPIGMGLYVKDIAPTFVDLFVARGRAEVDRRHEQVQQRVTTARSLGQVAMAYGAPMVRQRVQRHVTELRGRAEQFLGNAAAPTDALADAPADAPAETPAPPAAAAHERPTTPAPPLIMRDTAPSPPPPVREPLGPPPIPSSTPASVPTAMQEHPIARPFTAVTTAPVNGSFGPDSDELPIPGYDALSASQVVERLLGLTPGELEVVRTYETAHRNRRTILGKIEQLTV
jgi:ribosomal protein L12E/L44/L45/RPP1/RPP2